MKLSVKVKLANLTAYKLRLEAELAGQFDGPVRYCFRLWAARYRAWIQERFDAFSKGGGDWPPLKRKRKRGKKARASILRDTNTLFMAMSAEMGQPGSVEEHVPNGVLVGYGGPHKHPSGAGVTIADIASFHQIGNDYLPQRKIIVPPPQELRERMKRDAVEALRKR